MPPTRSAAPPARRPTAPGLRRAAGVLAAVALTAAGGRSQTVRAAVADAEAAGARIAVCVRDVDGGGLRFAHRAAVPQLPASNQKLITAFAFLAALGAEHRFRTGFRVERGTLRVASGGDPNWITGGPVDPAAAFADLAARLHGTGIRAVRGVEVDPGPFTGPRRPDGWPSNQRHFGYAAPTGGCVLDQGCWVVRIGPGADAAEVEVLAPPAELGVRGRIAMTRDRKQGGRYHVELRGDELAVRGAFLVGAGPRDARGAVDDPERLFVRALTVALARGGIRVDPAADDIDVELEPVSSPLAPALERTLAASSNFDAEQLLRVLGAELRGDGSFAGGLAALREVVDRHAGGIPDGVVFADGSGLSRGNRATASFLVEVLCRAARAPFAAAYVAALPRPGDEEATLEKRFDGSPVAGRVRAKTGTLDGVSALSGYLSARDGRLLAFAVLVEWDRPLGGVSPRRIQERIVEALDAAE